MDIFHALLTKERTDPNQGLYVALAKWIGFCSSQADAHSRRAKQLKLQHLVFSGLILLFAGAATIVSGVGANYDTNSHLYYLTLGLSALVSMLTGFAAVVDSSSRRKDHLNSEFQYVVLGRDIASFITMHPPGTERRLVPDQEVIGEFQRRLDNIESMAPPV